MRCQVLARINNRLYVLSLSISASLKSFVNVLVYERENISKPPDGI